MTGGIDIARRHFLAIAGLTLTAAGFKRLGSLVLAEDQSILEESLGRRMLVFLNFPESARVVGKAYLQHRPWEADIGFLVNSLVGTRQLRDARNLTTDMAALYRAFRAECRRDFEKGELVTMGGWYLARSEARVCGLAHML